MHALAARAARRELRSAHRDPHIGRNGAGNCAVVVLGFSNPGQATNAVNRWRARIGVRTAMRCEAEGDVVSIVCCGGAVRGRMPEADLLERAVRDLGWTGVVRRERESTSTWEKIANARRFLGSADRVAICSNGLHAAKAREYLRRQDPILAETLVPALDYRPGEMFWAKPLFAAVGMWKLFRVHRST
ncbi:YdcF family protein [Curtobacterium sp. MCSS17_008]|uniref:YdcF family protein n=1 Tax=Curtobacterium sp. MCSS17_008 TaxID=2175647 RepID=UPI0015E8B6D7|nr:ElyC/SanA/YdcF family protein [Curtobacterium sp. MCSS17_008]